MSQPSLDPRLGRIELTFGEPLVLGSKAMLVLGAALTFGGALISLLLVVDPPRRMNADAIAGYVFAGLMLAGGLAIIIFGLRNRSSKPTWHLGEHGAVRVTTAGPGVTLWWRDIPKLDITEFQQRGRVVGYMLQAGTRRIHVPDQGVAEAARRLWQAGRVGRPA